ncbi:hypothetical protein KCP74_17735 [Salmonella enterica subsp. enterica]|nr:hypothetical protein KCP74_17735 [Salmonella enterica subsp. enterica]
MEVEYCIHLKIKRILTRVLRRIRGQVATLGGRLSLAEPCLAILQQIARRARRV